MDRLRLALGFLNLFVIIASLLFLIAIMAGV